MRRTLAALGVIALAGCATTRITGEWQGEAARGETVKRMLVASDAPDESMRRSLEDELVRELRQDGIRAAPSYRHEQNGEAIDETRAREIASAQGYDKILLATKLTRGVEMRYSDNFYDYYGGPWSPPLVADRVYPLGKTFVQARLIEADESGELLWSATAETYEDRSASRAVSKLAKKLVDALEQDAGG